MAFWFYIISFHRQSLEKETDMNLLSITSRIILLACLICLASSTALASPPQAADPDFAAIDRFIEMEMQAQRLLGLALGIVHGDQIVHLKGFGIADPSGRAVTPQTPFIIGSTSKSFTALAVMQLVEEGKVELDAPVQRYLPWFRVADEAASAQITVRHLLYQTSGLSTKTGRSFQGSEDVSDRALEGAVRKLSAAELTGPVGATHQYSTINYSVLGLIVQTVSGQSYEAYIQAHIFDLLEMQNSFTSQVEAESQGLAAGYHYAFGIPRAVDLPYNRGVLPAGYLISSAEDMAHYLIAQLNDGMYEDTALLSPDGMLEMHSPAVPSGATDTSYGMGWFVGPINGIPAIHHQGETFNFHSNMILLPDSRWGVVVLINGENSMDLMFGTARIASIANGVTSLLAGQQPPTPPANTSVWVVYGILVGLIVAQVGGIIWSARKLQSGRLTEASVRLGRNIVLPLMLNLLWALITVVVLPKIMFGLPLMILATGLPDLGYTLLLSGLIALAWGILRTALIYSASRARSKTNAALMASEAAGAHK
jgi:CubicO group peptidase (beta-lactamase class C family)